jgi:succinate dehydrogenase flavin-adding protein (antitoxin of CptAB toxin-antitoxin module)
VWFDNRIRKVARAASRGVNYLDIFLKEFYRKTYMTLPVASYTSYYMVDLSAL